MIDTLAKSVNIDGSEFVRLEVTGVDLTHVGSNSTLFATGMAAATTGTYKIHPPVNVSFPQPAILQIEYVPEIRQVESKDQCV